MIRLASEKTQVIITTHSPELLNGFSIEDIAVMSRDENAARWFRPASRDSLVEMLAGVTGETLGDLHRSGEFEAYP
jgi:predicted ATPase